MNILRRRIAGFELLYKKNVSLDGYIRRAKSSPQRVNLPGTQPVIKSLMHSFFSEIPFKLYSLFQIIRLSIKAT